MLYTKVSSHFLRRSTGVMHWGVKWHEASAMATVVWQQLGGGGVGGNDTVRAGNPTGINGWDQPRPAGAR